VSRIEFAPEVISDFDRIIDHLAEHEVDDATSRMEDIIAAIEVLKRNPLIGKSSHGDKRELVIGRGTRGYVALYRYFQEIDVVFILAVRSQREAGYAAP
jgi:toxin ParE1/3/4